MKPIMLRAALRTLSVAASLLVVSGLPAMSAPLECPALPTTTVAGGIAESEAQVQAYGKSLLSNDADNAISSIIANLRANYPNITDADIVNYLAAIYCPALVQAGYSGPEAENKLVQFNQLVARRVFGTGN